MDYLLELRKYVGHRPLLMVGATVFVFDEEDRLLLLKRRDNKCWGPPGGAVEPGEVVEEAAKRSKRRDSNSKNFPCLASSLALTSSIATRTGTKSTM
jgi:ADP-ribose pyrophosphatase YjhB (NUDIX family)